MPTFRTTCPYCGVGCGVLATPEADGSVSIKGDPDHPANFGRLCSKGSALGETLSLEGRLLHPEVDGREVGWDTALGHVADTLAATIAAHGPDSVAFYGSGQLLTEDYYVANKLMKGFIGSGNIDTNSRLCMASSVAGHKRAFGSDSVPGNYEDIELADLVILVGSNLAWCHPVIYQRLAKAKAERPAMRIVVIDPRRTVTADIADLHLPIRTDGDVALFVGLLSELQRRGAVDTGFVAAHASGFSETIEAAAEWPLPRVAAATGLREGDIARLYGWFLSTAKVVTVFSQGVNQSATGTDKVNAIINCHLATGRIGRPGMGPFSITGQPNAMGGREVGGLANMLAAHMDFDPEAIDRVGRFWGTGHIASRPGLKATDLFRAIGDGRVKALWIMATNPVDSMPEADAVREALRRCPFVVVSDMNRATDTAIEAHVRLPAAGWGEKDGTVTNSERRISRQRPFLPRPGEARADWWIITQVARRMGFAAAFPYEHPRDIFAEHAALSAFENDGSRDFDLSGLVGADYETLPPTQWPIRTGEPGAPRMFGDARFFTDDGRARFVTVTPPAPQQPAPGRLLLNTGRVRDHWHTMTRTGKSARLAAHLAEPFAEIHPDDAARLGLSPAMLVRLENANGSALVRALITDRQQPGSVFVPMHWTGQFASSGRVDVLVEARTDPQSGQPALKMSEVAVEPACMSHYGFAVTRERPDFEDVDYWAAAPAEGGHRAELAWSAPPQDWARWVRKAFGATDDRPLLSVHDAASHRHNFALFDEAGLVFAVFVAPEPVPVSRQWAAGLLAVPATDPARRAEILAGRPGADRPDGGAIVCACFSVGINTIVEAITRRGCNSVDSIGATLKAGTNCGSCRAEIGALCRKFASPGKAAAR